MVGNSNFPNKHHDIPPPPNLLSSTNLQDQSPNHEWSYKPLFNGRKIPRVTGGVSPRHQWSDMGRSFTESKKSNLTSPALAPSPEENLELPEVKASKPVRFGLDFFLKKSEVWNLKNRRFGR